MKTAKRTTTMLLVAMLIVSLLPISVFAAAPSITPRAAEGYSYSSVRNSGYQLNAYTGGLPVNNTNVTVWSNTGSLTQRWEDWTPIPGLTHLRYVKNAANKSYALNRAPNNNCTTYAWGGNLVNDCGIKTVNEGMGSGGYYKFGLVLPERVLCLTATSFANGGNVNWQGPNGSNNQLWYIGMYY